jgi:hypothetical protein
MYPLIIGTAVLFIASWNYFRKKATNSNNDTMTKEKNDTIETFYRALAREKAYQANHDKDDSFIY